MNRINFLITALIALACFSSVACISKTPSHKEPLDTQELTKNQQEVHGNEIKPGDVDMTRPLNIQWVNEGKTLYDVICAACHKLTNEKLVGPGWKGLTQHTSSIF